MPSSISSGPSALPRSPWQADVRDLRGERWDVLVVGGGPAGATAALHLAARGRRVLLVERHAYPRDKACGDLLIPDAQRAIARAGLLEAVRAEARSVSDAWIESPSRLRWSIRGEYLLLPRTRFDELLARGAAAAGATVARGRAARVRSREDGTVEAHVAGTVLRARAAILATGADVSLAANLGMVRRHAPTAVAVRRYVTSAERADAMFLSFDRELLPGYGWIFPVPGDAYNVGVGIVHDERSPPIDLRALFDRFVRAVPRARALLAGARAVGPLRGARLRCGLDGSSPRGPGNVVAVGEQIATTYPFTGEGIGKAMESGEMAAEQVSRTLEDGDPGHLDDYARRIEAELRPRFRGYALAQKWLAHPRLNDLVAWRLRKAGYLREAVRGIVSETVDPAAVFSWRGILRSLVS